MKLPRILLVDDHKAMAKLVKVFAERALGRQIVLKAASNCDQALDLATSERFDLIILDNRIGGKAMFRECADTLTEHHSGRVMLLSGDTPSDFGSHSADSLIDVVVLKDDLSHPKFETALKSLLPAPQH